MSMCIETNCFIKPKRNEQYNTRLLGSITTFIDTNFSNSEHLKTLPWGHARSHTKFGPDWFSGFDIYWIQTERQTDKQSIYI